jgi:hypothetical protein
LRRSRPRKLRRIIISSKKVPKKKNRAVPLQFGALPYRITEQGLLADMWRQKQSGHFAMTNIDDKGGAVPCEVRVFPLCVKRQLKTWPEVQERELRWLAPTDATGRGSGIGQAPAILEFCRNVAFNREGAGQGASDGDLRA